MRSLNAQWSLELVYIVSGILKCFSANNLISSFLIQGKERFIVYLSVLIGCGLSAGTEHVSLAGDVVAFPHPCQHMDVFFWSGTNLFLFPFPVLDFRGMQRLEGAIQVLYVCLFSLEMPGVLDLTHSGLLRRTG